jgi:hypothetical protein
MQIWKRWAALAAMASTAAQPCLAAPLPGEGSVIRGRLGAFAGASLVLPLGTGRPAAATTRLRISPVAYGYDTQSGRLLQRTGAGVELGLSGAGKPELRLGGAAPAALKQRLGFKGSTGYIIVGGVLVAVALLAAVAAAMPKPGPRDGDF